jgi:hypothetical protein
VLILRIIVVVVGCWHSNDYSSEILQLRGGAIENSKIRFSLFRSLRGDLAAPRSCQELPKEEGEGLGGHKKLLEFLTFFC